MDVKDEYKDFIEEVNDKLKSPIYFYEEEFTDNYDSLSYISKQNERLQLEMELITDNNNSDEDKSRYKKKDRKDYIYPKAKSGNNTIIAKDKKDKIMVNIYLKLYLFSYI